MRKINLMFFSLLLLTIAVSGCSNNAKKPEGAYLDDAKAKYDDKKYDESITAYREFLKEYPKSDKAIFAYNQIAGIQIDALKNPQEGIKTYKELAEKFPSSKESKQAMFMVAFIYDETLKDKENAIKSYEAFLQKYPTDTDANDKMSESAKTMLEVLKSGKTIEEMIQQNIEKMGNQSSPDSGKVKVEQENTQSSGEVKSGDVKKKDSNNDTEQKKSDGSHPNQKKAGEDPAKKTEN